MFDVIINGEGLIGES